MVPLESAVSCSRTSFTRHVGRHSLGVLNMVTCGGDRDVGVVAGDVLPQERWVHAEGDGGAVLARRIPRPRREQRPRGGARRVRRRPSRLPSRATTITAIRTIDCGLSNPLPRRFLVAGCCRSGAAAAEAAVAAAGGGRGGAWPGGGGIGRWRLAVADAKLLGRRCIGWLVRRADLFCGRFGRPGRGIRRVAGS